jgi:LuxR family maltose regulon positive regulatory protein
MGTRAPQLPSEELPISPNHSFGRKDALMLFYLARGLKNREIADQMSLSVETVKWRLKLIYSKLYVRNRTEAISHARTLGLIR